MYISSNNTMYSTILLTKGTQYLPYASRLWMRIVPAADVLNVMPFTIAVPIMQPSARVRAPTSMMVFYCA